MEEYLKLEAAPATGVRLSTPSSSVLPPSSTPALTHKA